MQKKLLDCTLRETPNLYSLLGQDNIKKIISSLSLTGIDIVECGVLEDLKTDKKSFAFNHVNDLIPFLPQKNNSTLYLLLINYGHYDLDNLPPFDSKSVDGIRICFKKNERFEALNYALKIEEKGYKVFLQNYDTLGYSETELLDFIEKVNELSPYAYSIVDTFGAMYLSDLQKIYSLVSKNLDKNIKLGFHSHNNIMLADSNSQEFLKMTPDRDVFVDGTLLGCGRGAGNAHTEILTTFINKFYSGEYNLDYLLKIFDIISPLLNNNWGYSIPYFLAGVYETHVNNIDFLLDNHAFTNLDIFNYLKTIPVHIRKKSEKEFFQNLKIEK